MLRSCLLYLSEKESLKDFLLRQAWGRRLARRFIAGEELSDALEVVRGLSQQGFELTLNYLGESVREASMAEAACQVYLDILDRLAADGLRSHISVKLTQLGLATDEALTERLLRTISARAAQYRNFVRIDMESSAYVDATLRVFRAVDAPRDTLGLAIQSYLRRSQDDVGELLRCGVRIRLVKGAYKEPPEVAFSRKRNVDRNFASLVRMLFESAAYHAIATHDERLIADAQAVARQRRLRPDQYEFQMIYGIRRRLQRDLLKQGYRVRVYVPFGRQWYPYFMRRLAERPANLLFLLRNLCRA